MKKKTGFIITGILVLLLLSFGIYKGIVTPEPKKEITLDERIEEIRQDTKKIEEIKTTEDREKYIEELNERYSTAESAVEYFVVQAMVKDVNMYPEAFIPETFNEDIFGNPETDKVKLIESIMEKITRNGSLEKIEHKDVKWTLDSRSARVITDFYYKDLKNPIRLNIVVTKKENEVAHQEQEGVKLDEHTKTDFYYINSSVWNIIDTIEKGAE